MRKDTIHLAFICDDNYSFATRIALESIFENRNLERNYAIYIVSDDLSSESKQMFTDLSSDQVEIEIIDGGGVRIVR